MVALVGVGVAMVYVELGVVREARDIAQDARQLEHDVHTLLALAAERETGEQARVLRQWHSQFQQVARLVDQLEHEPALTRWPWRALLSSLEERGTSVFQMAPDDPRADRALATLGAKSRKLAAIAGRLYLHANRGQLDAIANLQRVIYILLASVVIVMLVFMWIVRRALHLPVLRIVDALETVGEGNRETQVPATGVGEYDRIVSAINLANRRLRRLTVSRDELRAEVTEREAAEQQALAAYQELATAQKKMVRIEKLSALGTLVGGVAHEINNPLMGIESYITFARDGVAEGKPRDLLDRALRQVQRISGIVRKLLVVGRLDPDAEGEASLPEVLDKVLDEARGELGRAKVDVEVRLPQALPYMHCHPDALHQILLNLVINASQAVTASGAEDRRVLICANHIEGDISVNCEDTGPGIEPGARERIFDPFFTTKPAGKGTGLGLSVSSEFAIAAGGKLEAGVSSELGGACFTLRLPAVAVLRGHLPGDEGNNGQSDSCHRRR